MTTTTLEQPGAEFKLAERVTLFLSSHAAFGLQRVTARIEGTHVTLEGNVHSWYAKQLAYQCTRRVAGVTRVDDAVQVVAPPLPVLPANDFDGDHEAELQLDAAFVRKSSLKSSHRVLNAAIAANRAT